MSTTTILYFAVGVFSLMTIGIVLTLREFKKLRDESHRDDRQDGR